MHPMLGKAIEAVREASKPILRGMHDLSLLDLHEKGVNDFFTNIDKQSEAVIIDTLQKRFPRHAYYAEESADGGLDDIDSEYVWVIDPLDGTTNYIHGFPHFCISVALLHEKKLTLGVIYDPVRDELFLAERNKGATLNQRRIKVSSQVTIAHSLLSICYPLERDGSVERYLRVIEIMARERVTIRKAGSACLDLAYLAMGRIDIVWGCNMKPWDMTAGALLVREAGGLLGDFQGGENYLQHGNLIAANPKLFKQVLPLVAEM